MKATAVVLARVEDKRFAKAVEGIRTGVYQVTVTLHNATEVRGFITSEGGRVYGCTITEAGPFCSCPDALYRGCVCKHAVALALYAIRHPQPALSLPAEQQPQAREPGPNLTLGKVRAHFTWSA